MRSFLFAVVLAMPVVAHADDDDAAPAYEFAPPVDAGDPLAEGAARLDANPHPRRELIISIRLSFLAELLRSLPR